MMATRMRSDELLLIENQHEQCNCYEDEKRDLSPKVDFISNRTDCDSRQHHRACNELFSVRRSEPKQKRECQLNNSTAKSSFSQFRSTRMKHQNGLLKFVVFLAFQLAYKVPKSYLQGANRGFANAQAIPIAYPNGFFGHNPLEVPALPTLYPPHQSPQQLISDQAMTSLLGQESLISSDLDWAKRVWPIGPATAQSVLKSGINYARQTQQAPTTANNRLALPERRLQQTSPDGSKLSTARGLYGFLTGSKGRAPARTNQQQRRSFEEQYSLTAGASIDPNPRQWPQAFDNLQLNTLTSRPTNNSFLVQLVAPNSIRRNSSEGFSMNLSAPYESPHKHVATVSASDLQKHPSLRLMSQQQQQHNASLRLPAEPPTDGTTNPISLAAYDSGEGETVSSEEPSPVSELVPDSQDSNDSNQILLHENQQWDSQQLKPEIGQAEVDESADNNNSDYSLNQQGEQQIDPNGDQSVHNQHSSEEDNSNIDASLMANTEAGNKSTESLMIQAANVDQASESFLTAQLPSQYDSVIRVPPDGHYDDYFKPDASNLKENSMTSFYGSLSSAATNFPTQTSASFNNRTTEFDVDDFTSGVHNNANLNNIRDSNQFDMVPPNSNLRNEDEDTHYRSQERQSYSLNPTSNHQHQISPGTSQVRFDSTPNQQVDQPKRSPTATLKNNFARQYYINQGPLRQQDAQNENSVEFDVTNATYLNQDGPNNHTVRHSSGSSEVYKEDNQADYNQDSMYAQQTTRVPVISPPERNLTAPSNSDRNSTYDVDTWRHRTRQVNPPQAANPTDPNDSIRLILANTNSTWRDSTNNEKMIRYTTSEGQDYAQPGGALTGPRHTFVNKDLNELPPGENNSTTPTRIDDVFSREVQRQSSTLSPIESDGNYEAPRLLGSRREQERRISLFKPIQSNTSGKNSSRLLDDVERNSDDDSRGDNSNSIDRSMDQGRPPGSGRAMQYDQVTPRPSSSKKRQEATEKKDQLERTGQRKRRIPTTDSSNIHSNPSMRAAQVTETHFDPTRDLVLNHPTQPPSVPESTISTITDLPNKVKRLRDNHADKNELMNELLTALDRVKSAIYKLQPLTAKMNAIYRKSVTSNTRDIIMDHHKGTYAKRYPPGDYDDTYDRMHPSELIERQRASSARKGRRAASSDSNRNNNNRRPQSSGRYRSSRADEAIAAASTTNSVYVPAPKEISDKFKSNITTLSQTSSEVGLSGFELRSGAILGGENQDDDESDKLILGSTKLVATGIGRRARNGRGSLSLRSSLNGKILYDDETSIDEENDDEKIKSDKYINEESGNSPASRLRRNLGNETSGSHGSKVAEDDAQSPLFGYRITIYQTPEDEIEDPSSNSTDSDEVSRLPSDGLLSYRVDDVPHETGSDSYDDNETMTTSESSLIPTTPSDYLIESVRASGPLSDAQDHLDLSESHSSKSSSSSSSHHSQAGKSAKKDAKESKKRNKSEKEEGDSENKSGKDKKKSMEKGDKKASKAAETHSKGKHLEEDKKRKKEFKKIKHNKGITSKESHKMHRDKQVKAHDRGAAKEKALKERTQIEFFEREQIVDDEFEKGKKSTMKANWASGHDAKKSSSKDMSGDSMTSGGSHLVKHYEPMEDAASASSIVGTAEHAHAKSIETSSGRESNKFEKKAMEAKGKKFKGWREKGYKIITETEFIDRGSLHDSAYKKRDKGAAHHQKLKKHEASSEGHHGSMEERLKKMARKEEKESTMEEQRKEMLERGKSGEKEKKDAFKAKKMSKKEMEEAKKKKSMQRSKHKKDDDDDHEQEESVGIGSIMRKPEDNTTRLVTALTTTQSPLLPMTLSTPNKTTTVIPRSERTTEPPERLARLMNADGHESSSGLDLTRQINWAHQRAKKDKPADTKQAPSVVEVIINSDATKKPQNASTTEPPNRVMKLPTIAPKVELSSQILTNEKRTAPEFKDKAQSITPTPKLPPIELERPKNKSLALVNPKVEPNPKDMYNYNDTRALKDADKISLIAELIQATVAEQNALRDSRNRRQQPNQERPTLGRNPLQQPPESQARRSQLQMNHKYEPPKMSQMDELELQQFIPPYIEQNVHIDPFGAASKHINQMQNFFTQTQNNNDRKIVPNFGFNTTSKQQLFSNFPILQPQQPQAFLDTHAPVGRTWHLL